jgi:DNA-binding HxlR family transcriptional regulator
LSPLPETSPPSGGDRIPNVPPPKRHPYDQWSPDSRALDLVGDKWTLLIVRDLASGPRRFVEIQRTLPGISTEQLRSRLNRMVADGLLTRQRYREVPPRVDYELTERAKGLMPVVGELARWGYRHAWGAPRQGERVDVGAIFRTAPGLMHPHGEGVIELSVRHDGEAPKHYTLIAGGGEVRIEERAAPEADAHIAGAEDDWVEALRPGGSDDGLTFTGTRSLATEILGGLTADVPTENTFSAAS